MPFRKALMIEDSVGWLLAGREKMKDEIVCFIRDLKLPNRM